MQVMKRDIRYIYPHSVKMIWDALRKITGDPNITWRDYKLNRYRDVAQKLDQIPYFDKDAVIAQFKAAFEADTVNGNTNQSFEDKTDDLRYGQACNGRLQHRRVFMRAPG